MSLLEVEDLHVSYGKVEAVRGVSLSLPRGQIVSVIGPNGAGKTTLLSAIMGTSPSRGTLRFEGEDLRRLDVEERLELGLCLVPEKRELFGEMSVHDNLLLGAFCRRLSKAKLEERLDSVFQKFPKLSQRLSQRSDTLSGGERQMLALGRALMSSPRVLMLDEPSLGLAPLIVAEVLETVRRLRDDGVSILLVEQNALAALQSSDSGYVLERGEVALEGDSSSLIGDPRIHATYLGGVAGPEESSDPQISIED